MMKSLNILTIVHENVIEKIKREEELKILKKFRHIYLAYFIFTCILLLWTRFPGFFLILFFPFAIAFNPLFGNYEKGFILLKFKEFYLMFLFSCLFSILILIWAFW